MRDLGLKGLLLFGALWFGSFLLLRQGGNCVDRQLPFAAFALAAAVAGAYGALYFGRRAWRLADTPIARIRSAPQGYVELYGRARLMDGPPILAPLSHLPCAWYSYRIEERSANGRWWPVDSGESDSLFLLDDGTGRCVIDPDRAHFVKTRRDVWYASESGMRSHALWGIGAAYRHVEQRIMPGEELHAIGGFRTVGGLREAPDTRREVAELLERWKRDPKRMALFDRRRNGRVDPDEWEAARRAAEKQVRRQQRQQATEPDVHLLADTGDPTRPFIIAAFREEDRLIRYFQWRAAGCLLATTLSSVFLLNWLF
ncbi:MAG: hypothetical protein IPL59_11000 [Candidatus Competibacteraceae bacterium]|uniref:RING-type E3 ubiquitin transferase n=1 Tax=Candidatus Contendobacter odensis Run_B_J11 TaxID=1400861 RepID=A0A7U7G9B2_9GAMM|nr:hypothetical protein [Candidatus Contendobacter odensis]MBK8535606.1 hypothetical protein [Candidatus Competibacteraceae bacterium]CDH43954.1 conserved membrane hypothetical protein [Candidatus Contendobacter odensis Run_B_J11]